MYEPNFYLIYLQRPLGYVLAEYIDILLCSSLQDRVHLSSFFLRQKQVFQALFWDFFLEKIHTRKSKAVLIMGFGKPLPQPQICDFLDLDSQMFLDLVEEVEQAKLQINAKQC